MSIRAAPGLALDRLSWTDDGKIRYQYKRPAPNGYSGIICDPGDFLAKLAALLHHHAST